MRAIREQIMIAGAAGFLAMFLAMVTAGPALADRAGKDASPSPVENIEILEHTWKEGFVWDRLNKSEATWTARILNNNPEPRHICLNVEFLDEEELPVFQNGKCEVVLGKSEGTISGQIMIQSPLIQDVTDTHVVALEAHRLHSYVK